MRERQGLTGLAANVHNLSRTSLRVALVDDSRIHTPTPKIMINPLIKNFEELQFMITGEIKSQIDALWNAFWTGDILNALNAVPLTFNPPCLVPCRDMSRSPFRQKGPTLIATATWMSRSVLK